MTATHHDMKKFMKHMKKFYLFHKIKNVEQFDEFFWLNFKIKCGKCKSWLFLDKFSVKNELGEFYKLCDVCKIEMRAFSKDRYIPKKNKKEYLDSSSDSE